ncbi:bifunctional [glutamine synthetase] adenylyltransferase/[glutamine synthetase]-adenylyl-L-tyrosine phosphorylase [Komagataeibacter sp. FNDCR2]|uniref:bifunctional [glutamine synthetase] adenylyltransferase/[glutamine synthetase]-adenylyl-L-tyrosine phosphorylase n=1 Tax=Komagataeibacter sp. FNDCR2 TaxID=2878682 RepID=UPI001E65C0C5|nr:bifunctional [glutamine synthetase] adenylyltransferase/[glutamine synthetase]-adenylyl-L-tyrosine phosphorylase [Komagataeibacter sp. FNDCR2]MCE2575078.1 bifunctional [glutamine synthetase] adenylyltransferase/[glutamine synthetase]-adenylyl-L-tyrosine phosphorylase [Komagataeibacter sp. FNDCR2]
MDMPATPVFTLHPSWRGGTWPHPADTRAARILRENLHDACARASLPDVTAMPETVGLIDALGGNSPYLSDLALRDTQAFVALLTDGVDTHLRAILAGLEALAPDTPRAEIMAALRVAKRQAGLAIALADIGGVWTLDQVTLALSLLAENALGAAVRHLLAHAHETGRLRLRNPETPCRGSGFVVLAMGKLGARELNYSSDIDLIILYDPDRHPANTELRHIFVRMTSDLVTLMEARDANGYVFRMDLRLRPDPAATPAAVSFPAAIQYYESMGRTWERAAMTKARPVAGDITAGRRFLKSIHPFIWRRHLDFAVIDDLHDMKARIDRHRNAGHADLDSLPPEHVHDPEAATRWLLGQNVKLGQGGIREVEFVVQALQLVWGGRRPELRDPTTIGALRRLRRAGLLDRARTATLARNYRMLRQAEHRLQMRLDHQTHTLPDSQDGFARFATFMLAADPGELACGMLSVMQCSRRIFDQQFAESGPQDITIAPEDADAADRLRDHGFPPADITDALQILNRWEGNRLRALRSDRARKLLRRLLPTIMTEIGARQQPLAVLRRFDALLERQWAGVQFLSLLERNPALIHRIVTVLDCAPFLADHLAQTPSALDGLLDMDGGPGTLGTTTALVRRHVMSARSAEQVLPVLRGLVCGEEFRLSVARLEHRMNEDTAARARSAMAETVMRGLLRVVSTEHKRRHGVVPGGAMAVMALGKAGSHEMMPGSDLDLMLVFDHPSDAGESVVPATAPADGLRARPLAAGTYFVRLAHAFIAALTAPGREGPLYEVDMRLRPSGSKGPVAVSLSAFRRYHAESAWTWERMALTRARVVAGPPPLAAELRQAIATALDHGPLTEHDRARIVHDVRHMRERLAREYPATSPWDIKRRRGGLMDVEFIAQGLQLTDATAATRSQSTRLALLRMARAGVLDMADARLLRRADLFWRSLQGLIRIICGSDVPDTMPAASLEILTGEFGVGDATSLLGLMDRMAARVTAVFDRLIPPITDISAPMTPQGSSPPPQSIA